MSPHDAIIVPGEDPAGAVQVPASCSHLMTWYGGHAGPPCHQAVPALTRAAGHEQTAGELYYQVSTAADRIGAALPEGSLQ